MATQASVFPAILLPQEEPEVLGSFLGGAPRGALAEIAGPATSGRTTLLLSFLAAATSQDEFCALIDVEDQLDPASAEAAGVRLSQLLWIRCGGNVEHALKAADLLAQAGGFGLLAIDLAGTPANAVRRIPLAAWFRLRHAVEGARTALIVIEEQINASSCSAVKIELGRERTLWRGRSPGKLFEGIASEAKRTRRHSIQREKVIFRR